MKMWVINTRVGLDAWIRVTTPDGGRVVTIDPKTLDL